MPRYQPGAGPQDRDMLLEMMQFVSAKYPDTLPGGRPLEDAHPEPEDQRTELVNINSVYNKLQRAEQKYLADNQPVFPTLLQTQPPLPLSPMHNSRLLLLHMGLLTRSDVLTPLHSSQKLLRAIKELDRQSGRETHKVGLIYVKHGQESQRDILRNDTTSEVYQEFVASLAWIVPLSEHRGFVGGLDRKSGMSAPYYATSTYEMMFHDVTRFPTNAADDQQVHKKRHVGNDWVQVVFSEHSRDYAPDTITSQFNDAHIVVYPSASGMFRVQINTKPGVHMFGPLMDGMVVPREHVAMLVRQTALNANRVLRYNHQGYKLPYVQRLELIDDIAHRYRSPATRPEYYARMSAVKPNPLPAPRSITASVSK